MADFILRNTTLFRCYFLIFPVLLFVYMCCLDKSLRPRAISFHLHDRNQVAYFYILNAILICLCFYFGFCYQEKLKYVYYFMFLFVIGVFLTSPFHWIHYAFVLGYVLCTLYLIFQKRKALLCALFLAVPAVALLCFSWAQILYIFLVAILL